MNKVLYRIDFPKINLFPKVVGYSGKFMFQKITCVREEKNHTFAKSVFFGGNKKRLRHADRDRKACIFQKACFFY